METLEPIVAGHPFFRGLDPRYLQMVATCASRVNFSAGQLLCRAEEEARQFFAILHGRVAVEIFSARRGPVTLQMLGEGEVLGWLWFDKPYHWHFDARALEITRVISLDVKALMETCEKNPDLGYELLKRYAHALAVQFRVARLQLMDMYGT
jgi:CRP/FNR family cyclic AMP-dependent transcriptional regulator